MSADPELAPMYEQVRGTKRPHDEEPVEPPAKVGMALWDVCWVGSMGSLSVGRCRCLNPGNCVKISLPVSTVSLSGSEAPWSEREEERKRSRGMRKEEAAWRENGRNEIPWVKTGRAVDK